jgi:hypothetical protein
MKSISGRMFQNGTRITLLLSVFTILTLSYSNCGELSVEELGTSAGGDYFAATVMPAFKTNCQTCHSDPRFGGNAPLSLYSYSSMLAKLAAGERPVDNALYNKMVNITAHTGGNVCSSGMNSGVCSLVIEWWKKEAEVQSPSLVVGNVLSVGLLGELVGWAGTLTNTATQVSVKVYIGGTNKTGTLLTQLNANEVTNIADPIPGSHRFRTTIPETYRNGTERSLYIYVVEGTTEVLMPAMPYKFTAFTQKPAGLTYFNNTVRNGMNGCNGCHTVSYDSFYYALATPTPGKGGTATNNELINNSNGESHSGGSFCGGNKNGGLCANIQQWWNIEFGN